MLLTLLKPPNNSQNLKAPQLVHIEQIFHMSHWTNIFYFLIVRYQVSIRKLIYYIYFRRVTTAYYYYLRSRTDLELDSRKKIKFALQIYFSWALGGTTALPNPPCIRPCVRLKIKIFIFFSVFMW